jgi:putative glutamine amidotransferase
MIVAKRPLVGVTCFTRLPEDPLQAVAERYLRAAPFMDADAVLVR